MRNACLVFSVVMTLLLSAATVPAQVRASGEARIVGVEHTFELEPIVNKSASIMSDPMPKFVEESRLTREVFSVTWKASDGGIEAGAVLIFEYRQKFAKGIRNLQVKYPFTVDGARQSTFVIPGKNVKAGGIVTAWRVRLVLRGRLLAEQTSSSWTS